MILPISGYSALSEEEVANGPITTYVPVTNISCTTTVSLIYYYINDVAMSPLGL